MRYEAQHTTRRLSLLPGTSGCVSCWGCTSAMSLLLYSTDTKPARFGRLRDKRGSFHCKLLTEHLYMHLARIFLESCCVQGFCNRPPATARTYHEHTQIHNHTRRACVRLARIPVRGEMQRGRKLHRSKKKFGGVFPACPLGENANDFYEHFGSLQALTGSYLLLSPLQHITAAKVIVVAVVIVAGRPISCLTPRTAFRRIYARVSPQKHSSFVQVWAQVWWRKPDGCNGYFLEEKYSSASCQQRFHTSSTACSSYNTKKQQPKTHRSAQL